MGSYAKLVARVFLCALALLAFGGAATADLLPPGGRPRPPRPHGPGDLRPPAVRVECSRRLIARLPRHVTINTVQLVQNGTFGGLQNLPPFCRVAGVSRPTRESLINFEVWLPMQNYNGKYQQVGNGGFSGIVPYPAIAEGMRRGYATAGTDDGSQTTPHATFVLNHPQRVIDYGHRALKETTDASKIVIEALAGSPPSRSYFHGCSNGGREALMEAQRYPDDFDGIIVGAPAYDFTHQFTSFVWNIQKLFPTPVKNSEIPSLNLIALANEVRSQCIAKDGGLPTDKFLTDPRKCKPDVSKLLCAGPPGPACLTQPQIDIVRAIYAGPKSPMNKPIFPGLSPGNEDDPGAWFFWLTGLPNAPGLQYGFGTEFFQYFKFGNPAWDYHTLNFGSDVHDTDVLLADKLNATDADLSPFKAHGGKIIHYMGWADAAVAPQSSINYYERVRNTVPATDSFYRLFMAPGMMHCGGGPGANAFGNVLNGPVVDEQHDLLRALERWVEAGDAPDKIVATKYVNDNPALGTSFQRPLCPYPRIAKHNGGNPNLAGSFACGPP